MRGLILASLALCAAVFPVFAGEDWHEAKSTHFVVQYHNAPLDFVQQVSSESERWYGQITNDLGLLRHDFWLWDNRAKVIIYDDAEQYQKETGMPAWSGGAALPRDKVVHGFYGKEGFFEQVLPHEIGHIIFREFVGFDNPAVPLWLDEGAASYEEKNGSIGSLLAQLPAHARELMSLTQLSNVNPHNLGNTREVAIFYAEAVGVIDFLIREYGKDDFVTFCRTLRDTRDFHKALSYAYSIRGIEELDEKWQSYLKGT